MLSGRRSGGSSCRAGAPPLPIIAPSRPSATASPPRGPSPPSAPESPRKTAALATPEGSARPATLATIGEACWASPHPLSSRGDGQLLGQPMLSPKLAGPPGQRPPNRARPWPPVPAEIRFSTCSPSRPPCPPCPPCLNPPSPPPPTLSASSSPTFSSCRRWTTCSRPARTARRPGNPGGWLLAPRRCPRRSGPAMTGLPRRPRPSRPRDRPVSPRSPTRRGWPRRGRPRGGRATEATAAERVATEGTAAERAAGVPGPAGILAAPWTAGTAPSAPGTSVAVPPPPEVAAPRADPAQGELLSGVDELLGTLPPLAPPAPLMPPPAPSRGARGGSGGGGRAGRAAGTIAGRGAPAPSAALRPGTAAAAAGRKLLAPLLALPRPVLLAGAGALLLAAGVAAWALIAHASRQAQSAARVVVAAPAAPPLKPGRSAAAKLFDAKSYLIFGREADARVRQALRELTYADQGALGPAGCRQLAAIEQTLAASALETAPQDLASGLRAGDLGTLESVVAVASDRDLPPRQRGDLERARNLVNQYELARAVAAGGDQAQVLERFRAVEGLSRTWRDPLELRDHAVQALEAEARALAIDGRYEEALGRLGPILRNWPERAGIKDLAKRYETASASEPSQLALLESVPSYESRRKPSEALDLLRPLQPTPHLEQRFAEAKLRLEAQLAQLDAQPPEVALRPGYPLDYWRGTVVTLSFRVTDDYEVKSVKVFARPEAGRLTEMPLQRSGFGWDVKIPPSFHQNGTVELYVVATDLSGHEGYLGSRENPLHLKRRQGFQQLLH